MIRVDAMGDVCPVPVVKTKNAVRDMKEPDQVEILVDNEISVQNLTKMAVKKGYGVTSEKLGDQEYRVVYTITAENLAAAAAGQEADFEVEECTVPGNKKGPVVAFSSKYMGEGDDKLGAILVKSFTFALTQQDTLPGCILCYNGGAWLSVEDSPVLEDLKILESLGVEILTCGTCLDFYGIKDKLAVGGVTNMYEIAEKLLNASHVVKP